MEFLQVPSYSHLVVSPSDEAAETRMCRSELRKQTPTVGIRRCALFWPEAAASLGAAHTKSGNGASRVARRGNVVWVGNRASSLRQGPVRGWHLRTYACLGVFSGHRGGLYSLTIFRGRAVTGSLDATVRVWPRLRTVD